MKNPKNPTEAADIIGLFQAVSKEELMAGALSPVTIATNMNPFQAAREIRTITKEMSEPSTYSALKHLESLRQLLATRSSRQARMEQLDRLEQALLKNRERVVREMQELARLAQHLPTQPGLPDSHDADLVRSFVAILKAHGKV